MSGKKKSCFAGIPSNDLEDFCVGKNTFFWAVTEMKGNT